MKLFNFYPLFASLSTAAELTQTGLILQHYGSNLLSSIMSSVGNYTQQDSDDITDHGCWCGKLDIDNHPYPEYLGGKQPVDELDEICRDWFMCRHCNDKLDGGSCNDSGNGYMARQYLLSREYTMAINETNFENSFCVESSDSCDNDTCVIDLYYASKIVSYYAENRNYFNALKVQEEGICQYMPSSGVKRCEGEVPYLKIINEEESNALNYLPAHHASSDYVCTDEIIPVDFQDNDYPACSTNHLWSDSNAGDQWTTDAISFCNWNLPYTSGMQQRSGYGMTINPYFDEDLGFTVTRFSKLGGGTSGCRWFGFENTEKLVGMPIIISFYFSFEQMPQENDYENFMVNFPGDSSTNNKEFNRVMNNLPADQQFGDCQSFINMKAAVNVRLAERVQDG